MVKKSLHLRTHQRMFFLLCSLRWWWAIIDVVLWTLFRMLFIIALARRHRIFSSDERASLWDVNSSVCACCCRLWKGFLILWISLSVCTGEWNGASYENKRRRSSRTLGQCYSNNRKANSITREIFFEARMRRWKWGKKCRVLWLEMMRVIMRLRDREEIIFVSFSCLINPNKYTEIIRMNVFVKY